MTKTSRTPIRNQVRVRTRLGQMLCANGVIDEWQLQKALERQKETHVFLGEILVRLGFVSATDLGPYLEKATGFPFVNLVDTPIDLHLARSIPEKVSRRMMAVAFAEQSGTVLAALADPLNLSAIDDLQALLGRTITPFLAFEPDILNAIHYVYDFSLYARRHVGTWDEGTWLPGAAR